MNATVLPWNMDTLTQAAFETVATGRTCQAESVVEVPLSTFTDPDLHQRELEAVFRRKPMLVGFSSELPERNTYVARQIMDIPLLLTRDSTGKVHALLNSCSHRGAAVTEKPCGRTNRFSCPYHAWTYDMTGGLVGIYDAGNFGPINKEGLGLVSFPVEERHGVIWVVFTPGSPIDVDDWLGELGPMVADMGLERYRLYKQIDMPADINWKVVAEGFTENYHFSSLHATTVGEYMHNNRQLVEQIGRHLRLVVPHKDGTITVAFYLFPNILLGFQSGGFITSQQMWPGATPDKSVTFCRYMDGEQDRTDRRATMDHFVKLTTQTIEDEDFIAMSSIQRALATKARVLGAAGRTVLGKCEPGPQFLYREMARTLAEDDRARAVKEVTNV